MKEQLISKIKTIAESEKFKQDAFFLCGAATGHPNQELLDACEAYLKTAESGEKNDDVVDRLIAELKKKNPYVEAHIFKSVENVNIETVIAYKKDGVKHHFLDDYDLK